MPYAIRNRRTKKWWYGTDYRYHPVHQRTDTERCMVFETHEIAKLTMMCRGCGRDYEVVKVEVKEEEE